MCGVSVCANKLSDHDGHVQAERERELFGTANGSDGMSVCACDET